MFGRDPINKLSMMLHAVRRYFHGENGLPNVEALKNINQVVAQQLLNSRGRYIRKHHNQEPSVPQIQAGDLILIKTTQPKAGKLQNSEDTWQQHGNQGLQRQHLNGTCHRCEEHNTDRTGCR